MINTQVDWFFNQGKWQEAFQELREILLDCDLTEELKWGCACYTNQKSNIVLIHGFKDYCALLFMQGALLQDAKKILVQQTKNVQSARQLRFLSTADILNNQTTIKEYVEEAVKNEKEGLKVPLKKVTEYDIPKEFQTVLNEMPELKSSFTELTPGRQRAYLLYFSSAKQSKTRMERVEKYVRKILNGKGLDD
jgi:uncharacterized protein YdeI (YjbR/CyaY-like superfamily)